MIAKKLIFEERLLKYIQKYPESYVGLWFLIQQLEYEGYSSTLAKGLQSFTAKIRKGKLWQAAHETLEEIEIRKDNRFPPLSPRDPSLKIQKIRLPVTKLYLG